MSSYTARQEIDCRFYENRLHSYVELELDEATSAFVAAHLMTCDRCRSTLEAHEADRLELLNGIVDAPELPSSFASKVTGLIRDREARQLEERRLVSGRFVAGLAAGVVLGALIATVALSLRQPTPVERVVDSSTNSDRRPSASTIEAELETRVIVAQDSSRNDSSLDWSVRTSDIIEDTGTSIFLDDEDDPCDDIDKNGIVDARDLVVQVVSQFGQAAEELIPDEQDCLTLCYLRS